MIVADSSFFVSFFLEGDANNLKALAIFEGNLEEILLPEIILFETLTVLDYKRGIEKSREAYGKICANRQIRIFQFAEDERRPILEEFFQAGGKLSVADACVAYLAKKTGSNVLSFDEGIAKALAKR